MRANANDLMSNRKRVNLSLTMQEYDDLNLVAEHQHLSPTGLASSIVAQACADRARAVLKSGYIPAAQRNNLFSKSSELKRRKRRV